MCTGMKNTPGKPCCGCTGCVINRIDINVGVPEPGQPGAMLGSFGWNITTQPAVAKVSAVIDGVTREVCKQTYTAPNLTPCDGPGQVPVSFNAIFKTLERSIAYDHWYVALVLPFSHWFVGNINFQTWAYIQNAKVEVYRFGSLARTVLSGEISQLATLQPESGARYRQYDSSCVQTQDTTYGTPLGSDMICGRSGTCFLRPFENNQIRLLQAVSLTSAFALNRDSGWVSGTCAALPTNDARTSPDFVSDAYNPIAAAGFCRIPSGSTLTTRGSSGGCSPGGPNYYDTAFTYSAEDVWFARHPIVFS